jgi:uncharacterized protein YpmB
MGKFNKLISAAAIIIMTVVCAISLLFSSCNQQPRDGQVSIPVPKDTSALSKIDHFIPQATINEFKTVFSAQRDSLSLKAAGLFIPETEAFNKPAVLEILKDPLCVGVRIYYGIKKGDKRNELRLILVGVDSQGKDLFITQGSALAAQAGGGGQGGLEYGQCPPCQK